MDYIVDRGSSARFTFSPVNSDSELGDAYECNLSLRITIPSGQPQLPKSGSTTESRSQLGQVLCNQLLEGLMRNAFRLEWISPAMEVPPSLAPTDDSVVPQDHSLSQKHSCSAIETPRDGDPKRGDQKGLGHEEGGQEGGGHEEGGQEGGGQEGGGHEEGGQEGGGHEEGGHKEGGQEGGGQEGGGQEGGG